MPYTSNELRRLVVEKANEGKAKRQIARNFNISHTTVNRIMTRYSETGLWTKNPTRGHRRRVLSIQTERAVCRAVRSNQQATARDIQTEIGEPAQVVSTSTIKRTIRRAGWTAYRPVKAPLLTPQRMIRRLQWCEQHQHMTVNDWKRVCNRIIIFKYTNISNCCYHLHV